MAAFGFKDRTILITGATGGLGSALAVLLSAQGARLALTARYDEALEKLAARLPHPQVVFSRPADFSIPGKAGEVAARALDACGHIDMLINNAGVGYFSLMAEADAARIQELFQVNTFAPLEIIRTLLPAMRDTGGGRIVNIVSTAGRVPVPSMGVYGGSKSALAVMTNTLRLELAPSTVAVINIYPGTVDTAFEENAMREKNRPGLCPRDRCGIPRMEAAEKILHIAAGPAGETWLERQGQFYSLAAIILPRWLDKRLSGAKQRAIRRQPTAARRWQLVQVESALACNLKCIMCPWREMARSSPGKGLMSLAVWRAIARHLDQITSVDFTGGGEPLLQPHLVDWIAEASRAGCETGFLTNGVRLDSDMSSRLLDAGIDWVCVSVDGATAPVYEAIRAGASFGKVCDNITRLAARRTAKHPRLAINFVLMETNIHQVKEIIQLAKELGVDQVNFKQCDVIRGENGRGFGLFADQATRRIRKWEKALRRARRLAKRLRIDTTAFAWTPEEQPVCAQDPRTNVFIRHDGSVAPCINLAMGGPTTFMGKPVEMPTVHYGNVSERDLDQMWQSRNCRFYRERFAHRMTAYETAFTRSDLEPSLTKLKEALENAVKAMPEAPQGCRVCHYLYNI